MTTTKYQAVATAIERRAAGLVCRDGVPVNDAARQYISARYRRVMNVLMRRASEAFRQAVRS